jgi:hypothetical protein
VADDVAHRRVEAARRVHRDEDERSTIAVGPIDSFGDVLGEDRIDLAADVKLDDAGGSCALE